MLGTIGGLRTLFDRLFSVKSALLIVSSGIVFGLACSLISQKFFGYVPCKLCLAQRFSFLISLFSLLTSFFLLKTEKHSWLMFYFIGVTGLLSSFSFSLYQLLVQFDFAPEPDFCTVNMNSVGKSIEELDEMLENGPYVTGCKAMGPTFFGLPISFFSCLLSIGGVFYVLLAKYIEKLKNRKSTTVL